MKMNPIHPLCLTMAAATAAAVGGLELPIYISIYMPIHCIVLLSNMYVVMKFQLIRR